MTIADFERLVDLALADGVLTPDEQQVLIARATELNMSPQELQMIIDARVYAQQQKQQQQQQQQQQAQQQAQQPQQQQSSKVGGIKRCPACGAHIQGFTASCPECGHSFSGVSAVASATRLFELLQECSMKGSRLVADNDAKKTQALNELNQRHNDATNQLHAAQNSGGVMSKIFTNKEAQEKARQDLAETQENEREALERQFEESRVAIERANLEEKRNIIKNFPVPNTKEDLMELLTMAAANAYDNDGVVGLEEEVWIQKTDQIYTKIKSLAGNDRQLLESATQTVVSLMTRLPKKYKNFTTVPEELRQKIGEQLRAAAINKRNRQKESFMMAFNANKIPLFISVGLLVLGFALAAVVDFFAFVGIIGLVGTIIFAVRINKSYKEACASDCL